MSDDDKVIPIGGSKDKSISSEAVTQMRKEFQNQIELIHMMAELQWEKYQSLVGQGFTKEQALELCKDVFGV